MKPLLAKIYKKAVHFRNFIYDQGWLDSLTVLVPVISVGNLSSGGTGKTPFVDFLVGELEKRNKLVGIVTRNYKALSRGTHQLDRNRKNGPMYFGDEAWLLALKHPKTNIYVGPQKWRSAFHLAKNKNIDVILIDDGFQHRALKREIDFVLIDSTAPAHESEFLPLGLARESNVSLERADFLVLTKINLASNENLTYWRSQLPKNKKIIETKMNYNLTDFYDKKVWIVSGIAKPQVFSKMIKNLNQIIVLGESHFSDHHPYASQDILRILELAKDCDYIITTEKDIVKIREINPSEKFKSVPIQFEVVAGAEELTFALESLFV